MSPAAPRRYPTEAIRRVSFIRTAQRMGVSLADIREALNSLPGSRTPTAKDWARLAAGWKPMLDERIAASVEAANRHIHAAGLAGRVTISERDAADPDLSGQYDLVTAFECIHDMPDPVGVLSSMRRLASGRGAVIVMDERVRETFVPETDLVEQFMYGFSILHCLPVGMLGEQPAGTGTVMRPDTLSGYARAAGFGRVELLPIESFFFNFYRLWP